MSSMVNKYRLLTNAGLVIMIVFIFLNINSPTPTFRVFGYIGAVLGALGLILNIISKLKNKQRQ